MSAWDGLNRRKFPRAKYPCMVTLWLGSQDEEIFLTHTENIGVGGVCLILNQRLERFSEVGLEIDLLDLEDHVKCRGKTMWVVEKKGKEAGSPAAYDVGIEFIDICDSDQRRIQTIVQQLGRYPQNKA